MHTSVEAASTGPIPVSMSLLQITKVDQARIMEREGHLLEVNCAGGQRKCCCGSDTGKNVDSHLGITKTTNLLDYNYHSSHAAIHFFSDLN